MPRKKSPRLKRIKNAIGYYTFVTVVWCGGRLPYRIGCRVGEWVGRRVYRFLKVEKRRIRKHLRIAFPDMSDADADRLGQDCVGNLGLSLFEAINFHKVRNRFEDVIHAEGFENLRAAVERGRGVIVITAHTGNWELMAAHSALKGLPVNAIARSIYDERIDRYLRDFRASNGVKAIVRGDAAAGRASIRALKRGEIIALLIDQDTRVPSTFVTFFGRPASTPIGAAQLALRFGAEVLAAFSWRAPDKSLHVTISEPIELIRTGDTERDLRENTQRFTRVIEDHIRAHPADWVWMHRRWKTAENPPQ